MSRWTEILGHLRREVSPDRLVGRQREAAVAVVLQLRSHDTVNLCGPAGSGKTYLGWAIARATGAAYAPTAAHLGAPNSVGRWSRVPVETQPQPLFPLSDLTNTAVIDECPSARLASRSIVAAARAVGFRRVVLISREPIGDQVPKVDLRLELAERDAVIQTFASLGWRCDSAIEPEWSLWDCIWSGVALQSRAHE